MRNKHTSIKEKEGSREKREREKGKDGECFALL